MPSWIQCERDIQAPDCFVDLSTPTHVDLGKPLHFGGKILVAQACDAQEDRKARLRDAVVTVARALDSPLTVHQSRPWGKASYGGFSAAMNDLIVAGLFSSESPHDQPLGLATFAETWSPVPL